jgi:hypothetical protein
LVIQNNWAGCCLALSTQSLHLIWLPLEFMMFMGTRLTDGSLCVEKSLKYELAINHEKFTW